MVLKPARELRCAIYTRKSTEHGLELEFNSLDAQREACEAYIKSQASEGWKVLSKRYDDPAYSGGNMDRPALQHLLKDIDAGLVDVVVVYKIDRLTRSLADFAKLVEVFDAKTISFVAVTQQFNTTTSMGRLTLNVLLSFAQFERELSSERVRDKVAASRKRGKWMGGSVPLGYDTIDKKLVMNSAEAETVRMIFARYLTLRSFQKLVDELNAKDIVTKTRALNGKTSGGISFTYGPLAYLLKNRTYLGETGHKGSWFPGEHEAIVEREVFEQVQHILKANSLGRTGRRQRNGALLAGLIFDDRGNRMSPSFTVKRGIRYPFYISSALLRGRKTQAGSVTRVSATDIETAVLRAVRDQVNALDEQLALAPHEIVNQFVERVIVWANRISVTLKTDHAPIEITWAHASKHDRAQIEHDPINEDRCTPNPQLVRAIVRAHIWLKSLSDGTYDSIDNLARAVELHPKVIRSRIRLAFLAPDLTQEILQGTQSARVAVGDLIRLGTLSWRAQRVTLQQPSA